MLQKRFWVPGTDNDYRPDGLQQRAVVLMTFLVLITFLSSNIWALLWQQSDWLVGAVLPAVVIEQTNTERSAGTLPALQRNPVLDEAAKLKAEHMAAEGYFAHFSPAGVTPWHWFSEAGYTFVHAGENLAVHFTDSDEVVDAWMNSPTHRANIMNSSFTEIGVGTARGEYEGFATVFVVQLFGTPAATGAVPPVAVAPEVVDEELLLASKTDALPVASGFQNEVAGVETYAASSTATIDDVPSTTTTTVTDLTPVPASPVPVTIAETVTTDSGISMYTDTIATSTNLTPAATSIAAPTTEAVFGPLTSSGRLLSFVYLVTGLIVIGLLVSSVCLEWRQQRYRQVLYGVALLFIMSGLFWVHQLVTGGVVIM